MLTKKIEGKRFLREITGEKKILAKKNSVVYCGSSRKLDFCGISWSKWTFPQYNYKFHTDENETFLKYFFLAFHKLYTLYYALGINYKNATVPHPLFHFPHPPSPSAFSQGSEYFRWLLTRRKNCSSFHWILSLGEEKFSSPQPSTRVD